MHALVEAKEYLANSFFSLRHRKKPVYSKNNDNIRKPTAQGIYLFAPVVSDPYISNLSKESAEIIITPSIGELGIPTYIFSDEDVFISDDELEEDQRMGIFDLI